MMQIHCADATFESKLFEASYWESYLKYMDQLIQKAAQSHTIDFFSASFPLSPQGEDRKAQPFASNSLNNSISPSQSMPELGSEPQLAKEEEEKEPQGTADFLLRKKARNAKICSGCPHHFARHYAKNMCSNCYHSKGRVKKPWNCSHSTKTHYALGLCQNCYQMNYTKSRKDSTVPSSGSQDLNEL